MTQHHSLPGWYLKFQDTVGLSLLVLALMGINGIVYASGVVGNVEQPSSWGVFGTVLFVLFFAAGTAMPGVALRAGAGMFIGEWYRRLACLLVSLLFFALEIWCSITERSLTTVTSPADRWLLAAIGQPNLPFSPTVLVISFAISLIVVVWGLVTGVSAIESAEDVAHREELKTIKARANAERWAVRAAGIGSAGRAAIEAAKQGASGDANPVQSSGEGETPTTGNASDETPGNDPGKAGGTKARGYGQKAVPSHMMSAPQFRQYLRENGVGISAEKAVAYVQSVAGCEKVGTMYAAPKAPLMRLANRLIDRATTTGNETSETGALAG